MTHEYTVLFGGTVMAGGGGSHATAIAWAGDTVIAIGNDADVRAISRGDSHFFDLAGAWVLPFGDVPDASWPTNATWQANLELPSDTVLDVGGRADLVVVEPSAGNELGTIEVAGLGDRRQTLIAVVRRGQVVAGALPGAAGAGHLDPEHLPGS